MWLCYKYLRGLVIILVFEGCGYVMGIEGVCVCYGYFRDVVMLWVFNGCGYVMGI